MPFWEMNMTRYGTIALVLGVLALGIAAFGATLSFADPKPSGQGQTGLTTTGLGI